MPVRPLALLRRRRARPRAAPRVPRISHCGSCRAGRLRRGHPRGADGSRAGTPSVRVTARGRPWIARLSGTTLEPSTAARGAARWTSSQRAIRASRFPLQASGVGRTTRATSGRMSPASSARSSRPSCSSRMSPIISASAFPKSPEDWSTWATALRRASSRRRKSVRPTSVSCCSSSPTEKAANWPTPRACSGTRSSGGNRTELLRLWPTPMASDGHKPSAGKRKAADLTGVSRMWMTPTARDHKDGATSLANTPVNGLLGRQVLATPMAGGRSCDTPRTLNPLFVEALMGWPTGWTGFGYVATEWSRWSRRMRCELWQLNCWPMDEVAR
ncbi:hypothetical protein SAMN04488119_108147 [Oceanicella actignis]|nr:hypothetical protein SAMN04488119_108147 [Oceanicella actignis]